METLAELENYAMATLKQENTGSVVMWMTPNLGGIATRNKEPTIKVRTDSKDTGTGMNAHSVSIIISDNPAFIESKSKSGNSLDNRTESSVVEFIKRNKDVLLQFWHDEIDSEDLKQKVVH